MEERRAEQIADVMFALSAPSRLQILECLLDVPQSVSQLVSRLGVEQSAVSHQLRVLREHELVTAEKHGRRRVYAMADPAVAGLLAQASELVDARSRGRRRATESTASSTRGG